MRIGSRVSIAILNEERGDFAIPDDAPVGTIIHVERNCDQDGYEFTSDVTIRWDDGLVEKREIQADGWEVEDITPTLYANVYLHDRQYGGPEEGGWFYDTYAPIDGDSDWDESPPAHGHFPTIGHAEKAMEQLVAWCNDQNSRRRSPSSMASEGHFVARLESWPAEFEPARRPHYC